MTRNRQPEERIAHRGCREGGMAMFPIGGKGVRLGVEFLFFVSW